MNAETEIAELKKEITRLRREMNNLHRFISVETDEAGQATNINIRCCILTFAHPDDPNRTQCMFSAGSEGAVCAFSDKNEKPRLILSMDEGEPCVELLCADGKQAVEMTVQEKSNCGQVAVFDADNPRAVMKAVKDGAGAVSVCHDDGKPRMAMRSEMCQGEIIGISPDMKTTVRIEAGAPHGGLISLHNNLGTAGVIISNTPMSGGIIVNDRAGKIIATLPDIAPQKQEGEE